MPHQPPGRKAEHFSGPPSPVPSVTASAVLWSHEPDESLAATPQVLILALSLAPVLILFGCLRRMHLTPDKTQKRKKSLCQSKRPRASGKVSPY
eukprot:1128002-Pelagomonas_calceolata.AAC.6